MAFTNRIRLPLKLHKPQFVEESERYRKANGETVTLSVVIRKVYEGVTDELPEKLHERLKIALAHDNVQIEGDKYVGVIAQDGDYNIEWSDFLSRPIAQAKFKAEVTPFNATNSNCGTCEEYTQVVAEDDNLGDVDEGDTLNVDILANDSICCSPVTISIVTFSSTYANSAVVNPDNTITIQLKSPLPDSNSVILGTYRVQCANGMYDDANIIANIQGTDPAPVCLAPTNPVLVEAISYNSASFSWTAPSPVPDCGYHWEIRSFTNILLSSGDTVSTSVTVTDIPDVSGFKRFYVRSNCCSTDSNYAGPVVFTLPPEDPEDLCGSYTAENTHFILFATVTYIDCGGNQQSVVIPGNGSAQFCALQTSACNPVEISPSNGNVVITCNGLC